MTPKHTAWLPKHPLNPMNWLPEQLGSLRVLIIAALVLGIAFRFIHLDRKTYWIDETYTSLRLSGHTETELVQTLFTGDVIGVDELLRYQRPDPATTLSDTLHSLATESPQHPPLYYILGRWAMEWFGSSVAVPRGLAAILSLPLLPAMYWLCWELFGSVTAAWIGVALVSISPFHVLYAQEAREYSFWAVTTVLSCAALLRAMRSRQRSDWLLYAATVALGLYTFLFTVFINLGQAIYVAVLERWRWTKTTAAYVLSTIIGCFAFLPWIWIILANWGRLHETTAWTFSRRSLGYLMQRWLVGSSNLFFDFNLGYARLTGVTVILVALVVYAFFYCIRKSLSQVWLLIVTLTVIPAACLIVPDLVLGGVRSINPRYLVPTWIGMQLAVTYLISAGIEVETRPKQPLNWGRIIFTVLFISSVVSCSVSSQAVLWWNKDFDKNQYNAWVASIINQADRPLVVADDSKVASDCFACRMMTLSYSLDPKVKLQLVLEPNAPKIPTGFSDILLLNTSKDLSKTIEKTTDYQVVRVFRDKQFLLQKLIQPSDVSAQELES
ncbi:glycosyltransferase family 39 protein [Pantanalinema sp. GBBB05]|uniref:glycosyltransferase family 39 protein n=1 Tax=Pantanalinema sp. GBBB05 TaxID=2604139 RepID=UPI001DDBCB37|nr:hypothetical protein [Pantanalinema sp. GBBB05]